MEAITVRANASQKTTDEAMMTLTATAAETGERAYLKIGKQVAWGVSPTGMWAWGMSYADVDAAIAGQVEAS